MKIKYNRSGLRINGKRLDLAWERAPRKQRSQDPRDKGKPKPSQTREGLNSPFSSSFNSYNPLEHNIGLFRVIREAIPFIDVGITRSVRLLGDFSYTAKQDAVLDELNRFKRDCPVNHYDKGLVSYIAEKSDSVLCTGMGFSELVPTRAMNDIHRLKTCKTEDFRFVWDKKEGRFRLGIYDRLSSQVKMLENEDMVYYLAFEKRDGGPSGYSMLYGLPFVAQIFTRMEKSWDNFMWRVGDPTYTIIVKAGEKQSKEDAEAVSDSLSSQLGEVMDLRRQGQTADLHGAIPNDAEVTIEALGADANPLKVDVPISVILEQLIAKTGFSPAMLGASQRHGNYQVTKDQNDLIVADIKWRRRKWEPEIERITDTYLAMIGKAGAEWGIEWHEVNLMDEKVQAESRKINAEAAGKEIENVMVLLEWGAIDQEEAEDRLLGNKILTKKPPEGWWTTMRQHVLAKRTAKGIFDAVRGPE